METTLSWRRWFTKKTAPATRPSSGSTLQHQRYPHRRPVDWFHNVSCLYLSHFYHTGKTWLLNSVCSFESGNPLELAKPKKGNYYIFLRILYNMFRLRGAHLRSELPSNSSEWISLAHDDIIFTCIQCIFPLTECKYINNHSVYQCFLEMAFC